MHASLRELLERGHVFRAVKLPIYRLVDEKIVGYELLTRGPKGPYHMPEDFLRASIEEDILTLVDLTCLKTALAASAQLKDASRLHVNLFPSTIIEMGAAQLVDMFPADRQDGQFCIEIIEQQQVSDYTAIRARVKSLKGAGISLALDDVGFGASSLETLIFLEPEIIKIDRRFVTNAGQDSDRERYLQRLVGVARALGAELVAEGIDSRADLALMKKLGVEFGQGFLWGRPE